VRLERVKKWPNFMTYIWWWWQTLGSAVRNSVTAATWRQEFRQPWATGPWMDSMHEKENFPLLKTVWRQISVLSNRPRLHFRWG
jgi:hypothetical protein